MNFVQTLVPELFGEDLQHGTNPRSQERVKHTHTHASASAAPLPLRSAELRGARIQHRRYAAAGHGCHSCAPFPPPPHPVRQPSAPAGKGNPSPKPLGKKLNAKLPLRSTPSPVTLQKGGRYQLAACCRGQETLGAERSLRDGRAPRPSRRAPLMAALPPGQPQAGIGHRAALLPPRCRHPGLPPAPPPRETWNERRGNPGTLARRGGTGRDGAGTPLKGSRALPGRRRSLSPRRGRALLGGGECSGPVGASGLPHPGSQPAYSGDPKTGCSDLSVLFSDSEHRSVGRALGSCLESLEPPRELAWGLQQQGSSPRPFPTEPQVRGQASTSSCCTSYPRAQARRPISMAGPPAPPWRNRKVIRD